MSNDALSTTIASPLRSMQICNACRYCENLCAVFPAMTDMREFDENSLDYLSNLCHQCGACFEACQYAPPHAFAVNVKQALNEQRAASYARFSPSPKFWKLADRLGAFSGLLIAAFFTLILCVGAGLQSSTSLSMNAGGDFYQYMPHSTMALLGFVSFAFGIIGSLVAGIRFSRQCGVTGTTREAWNGALKDATTLRYLGDDLCGAERGGLRQWQKVFHHLMTGGFMLCFLSTSLGTLTHYVLGVPAPYPWYSATGLTGTLGGLTMLAGTSGLVFLKMYRPASGDDSTRAMDISLVTLLWGVASTGLVLRLLGHSEGQGWLLFIHLGFVFAFFVTLPFSKMIHIPFRLIALARFHMRKPA